MGGCEHGGVNGRTACVFTSGAPHRDLPPVHQRRGAVPDGGTAFDANITSLGLADTAPEHMHKYTHLPNYTALTRSRRHKHVRPHAHTCLHVVTHTRAHTYGNPHTHTYTQSQKT